MGLLEGLEDKDGMAVGRTTGGDSGVVEGTARSTGIEVGTTPETNDEGDPCATGWADGSDPAYLEGFAQVGGC